MRIILFGAALVLGACNRDRPNVTAEDATAPALGLIVDVSGEGAPKITGTGTVAEVRATAMTPWKRALVGADEAKIRGARSIAFAAGDMRTKPIDLPRAMPGGEAVTVAMVSIGRNGTLSVNGAAVASPAEVGRSLTGGPPSQSVIVSAHESVELGKVVDVVGVIQPLGRPLALSIEK